MAKQVFFRRKKACPFSGEDGLKIDYKDVKLLSRYISEKGKIIPGPRHQTRPLYRPASVCCSLGKEKIRWKLFFSNMLRNWVKWVIK